MKETIALAAKVIAALGFTLLFIFNVTTVVERDSATGDLSVTRLQASAQGEDPYKTYYEQRMVTYDYSSQTYHIYCPRGVIQGMVTCPIEIVDCYGSGGVECSPSQSATGDCTYSSYTNCREAGLD